jgi:CelD/BcsL family acetyltransferase involved in cellulose biosynthesis
VDTVTAENELEGEFEAFVSMHERQWQNEGHLGHFGDWPGAKRFHLDMARQQAQLGRLRLLRLTAGNTVLSYRYGMRFGRWMHAFLCAREPDLKWDKYGLGRLVFLMSVERAIQEGADSIEDGQAHYDHKVRLGGQEYPLCSVLVVSNRLGARLRSRLFCAGADLLDLAYYRIWFSRLAPRLPLRRRSLWVSWIHSRI